VKAALNLKAELKAWASGEPGVSVPGTARVRVAIPGYLPETKSIFMDYAPLRELILNLHSEQLIEWATFEEVRELLGEVKLHFALKHL
jgi:hypothetical protein